MLHTALEEYGRGQGEHITRLTGGTVLIVYIVMFVEGRASEVHGTDGVTDEGMDTGIHRLGITGPLSEVQVL